MNRFHSTVRAPSVFLTIMKESKRWTDINEEDPENIKFGWEQVRYRKRGGGGFFFFRPTWRLTWADLVAATPCFALRVPASFLAAVVVFARLPL